MLIRQYRYLDGPTVDLVSLAPRESYRFDAKGSEHCVATIYTSDDVIEPEDGQWKRIRKHRGLRLRKDWLDWNTKVKTAGERRFRGGPGPTAWTCLSHAKTVQHTPLDGRVVIPAGWGFVVASGHVVLGAPNGPAGMAPPPVQRMTVPEVNRENEAGSLCFRLYANAIALRSIEGGGQEAEPGNYFLPLEADDEVRGRGDLLLVR